MWAVAVLWVCGCSSQEREVPRVGPTTPSEADPVPVGEPEVPADEPIDEVVVPSTTTVPEGAPDEGCAFSEPLRVAAGDAWVDVAASADGFVVAGVSRTASGEQAFAVAIVDGSVRQLALRALDDDVMAGHRRAPSALAIRGRRAALAFVDGRQQLLMAFFDTSQAAPFRLASVASSASLRFAPSLAWLDDTIVFVAWTVESVDGRRVLLRRVADGGSMTAPVDVTPSAGGAAAPSFVAGASPPRLVFLDPREALSVAHRVDLSAGGPSATEVARPISLVTDPPITASVRMHDADWLVYTGLGSLASTAVGLVALAGSSPPSRVNEQTGYGVLHADVDTYGGGAVIVADAPTESPPAAPRQVHLRTVDAAGSLDDAVVLTGPHDTASRARVAAGTAGIVVAFVEHDGAYVVVGRCAAP